MIPKSKPQITRDQVEAILEAKGVMQSACALVGIVGYFLDSMGKQGANDRGIYDDALIWISPTLFATYNANLDPSTYRKGSGHGSGKGIATLKNGLWTYKTGIHYGSIPHAAFRQAAPVIVLRDGYNGPYESMLASSINIHRGGVNSTSSLGCQTLPPAQWDAFKQTGYAELARYNQKTFQYLKMSEQERRQGILNA